MKYYVYIHLKEDTLEPFYVGKGQGGRAFYKYNRSQFWNNIVNKHGYLVKVVMQNLSEEEALSLERETIKNLRNLGLKLCNFTEGGDGVSGLKHSEESKQRMSEAKRGKPNIALKGKPKTPEHIERIASQKRGKSTGPFTEERCNKISETKKGKQLAQIKCPHCNKSMSKALEARYNHIEKCKENK